MKPRIAITADTFMDVTNSTNLRRAPYVSRDLVEVLSVLGCIPFILPDVPNAIGEDYFELYDGLIILIYSAKNRIVKSAWSIINEMYLNVS